MKTAWVTVQEWDRRTVGQIERISTESEWPIFCVNNGSVLGVPFDETNIASGYEKAVLIPANETEFWSKQGQADIFVQPLDTSWTHHDAVAEYWSRVAEVGEDIVYVNPDDLSWTYHAAILEFWSKDGEANVNTQPLDLTWTHHPIHAEYWTIEEDTSKKNADAIIDLENRKVAWEKACLLGGQEALAKFNRLLSKYSYGETEIGFFMSTQEFITADYLINHGALNSCAALLASVAVTPPYTQEFKDDFIAIVTDISNAIGDQPV